MPNPNYMEMQKDLAWKMRGILTDWLIQVHSRFRLLPETLFLCVNIINCFLSVRIVSLVKLQLVGITCMFIAAETDEIISPPATHADSSYSETETMLNCILKDPKHESFHSLLHPSQPSVVVSLSCHFVDVPPTHLG